VYEIIRILCWARVPFLDASRQEFTIGHLRGDLHLLKTWSFLNPIFDLSRYRGQLIVTRFATESYLKTSGKAQGREWEGRPFPRIFAPYFLATSLCLVEAFDTLDCCVYLPPAQTRYYSFRSREAEFANPEVTRINVLSLRGELQWNLVRRWLNCGLQA